MKKDMNFLELYANLKKITNDNPIKTVLGLFVIIVGFILTVISSYLVISWEYLLLFSPIQLLGIWIIYNNNKDKTVELIKSLDEFEVK